MQSRGSPWGVSAEQASLTSLHKPFHCHRPWPGVVNTQGKALFVLRFWDVRRCSFHCLGLKEARPAGKCNRSGTGPPLTVLFMTAHVGFQVGAGGSLAWDPASTGGSWQGPQSSRTSSSLRCLLGLPGLPRTALHACCGRKTLS